MYRICYMSRATAAAGDDMADIRHVARTRNEAADLTGLSLSDGARLLQAIEGPKAQLRACFDRIRADRRHYDVVIVSDGPIEARRFGEWAMRHHDRRSSHHAVFKGSVAHEVNGVTDAGLKAMLIGFAALGR